MAHYGSFRVFAMKKISTIGSCGVGCGRGRHLGGKHPSLETQVGGALITALSYPKSQNLILAILLIFVSSFDDPAHILLNLRRDG